MLRTPPTSTLFPYTTLFRSCSWTSASPRSASPHACWRRRAGFTLRQVDCASRYAAIAPSVSPLSARRSALTRRSEEHTSELQSQFHLVCRLLLEKKKKNHHLDLLVYFFFNAADTSDIYTLSLHDALPILLLDFCFAEERVAACLLASARGLHVTAGRLRLAIRGNRTIGVAAVRKALGLDEEIGRAHV